MGKSWVAAEKQLLFVILQGFAPDLCLIDSCLVPVTGLPCQQPCPCAGDRAAALGSFPEHASGGAAVGLVPSHAWVSNLCS